MPAERLEALLPRMELLIGQADMPKERLDRARNLRAIINVETNFLQNVDYDTCFSRGIHVLAPGGAFARPVAEMALGMVIDLCRGVTTADRAMRSGREKWLLDGARRVLLPVPRPGWDDRFRRPFARVYAAHQPFGGSIKAYDPWVSDHFMRQYGVEAASLEEILRESRVIVIFAAVTSENQHFLGKREFEMIAPGSVVLLMSRAGVVDFPEFLRQVQSGRFRAATDVFPVEPAPADDPARKSRGPPAVAASGRRADPIP